MKSIDVVFLDFDGVILESLDIKGWAFSRLFADHPDKVPEIVEFHHANGGMPRFDKFRRIYRDILRKPLSEDMFEALCRRFSELVFERILSCDFVPGAREFLEKNAHRRHLYIVSGTPHEEIREIVKRLDLVQYVEGVYGSPTKKADWTRQILTEKGYAPERAVFVGDAMSDYQAAAACGIAFVARILNGRPVFDDVTVDAQVRDLLELDRLLNPEEASI